MNEPKLSHAIVFMLISAILLSMPAFFSVGANSLEVMGTDILPILSKKLIDLITGTSYIGGLGFGMKAALALKEFQEYGYSEPEKEEKLENSQKEILNLLNSMEPITVTDKVIAQVFNFENNVLNTEYNLILEKITEIESMPALTHDFENKLLIDATKDNYLPQIIDAYQAIPITLRDKNTKTNLSATEMTLSQLKIIHNKLIEIETCVLGDQQKDLRVLNDFLKEKMSVTQSFVLNNLDKTTVEYEVEKEINS